MPKKPTKPEDKNVMDVSRPGKSAPSASSRPIIVSRKPIIQDPMVRENSGDVPGPPTISTKETRLRNLGRNKGSTISIDSEGEMKNETEDDKSSEDVLLPPTEIPTTTAKAVEEPAPEPLLPAVKEIVEPENIKSRPDRPVQEEPEATKEKEAKPTEEKRIEPDKPAEDSKKATDEPEDTSKDEKEESSEDDDTEQQNKQAEGQDGIVDELAKQAMSKKQKQQEEKDQQNKSEQMDKLIAEKKYFLPIGQVTRRKKNRTALLVLILIIILAAVGANFAVDAGLVKTNIKPLTNVFPD